MERLTNDNPVLINSSTELSAFGEAESPFWFSRAAKVISDAWFNPKGFEEQGEFYKRLGIGVYKRYLPTSGDLAWHASQMPAQVTKDIDILEQFERQTRNLEAGHLICFVGMALVIISAIGYNGVDPSFVGGCVAVNTLVNAYPIMLQRYNRARLYRVLQRLRTKNNPLP